MPLLFPWFEKPFLGYLQHFVIFAVYSIIVIRNFPFLMTMILLIGLIFHLHLYYFHSLYIYIPNKDQRHIQENHKHLWWSGLQQLTTNWSSRLEVFCRKYLLRNLAKCTGKYLCRSLFFNKVAGLAWNVIKKVTLAQVFSCAFCEISKNTFFTERLRWLLLY